MNDHDLDLLFAELREDIPEIASIRTDVLLRVAELPRRNLVEVVRRRLHARSHCRGTRLDVVAGPSGDTPVAGTKVGGDGSAGACAQAGTAGSEGTASRPPGAARAADRFRRTRATDRGAHADAGSGCHDHLDRAGRNN